MQVSVDGDNTATWTCTQHPDECGVVVTYTADPEPEHVDITVHVLGAAVFNRRMVIDRHLHFVYARACVRRVAAS